MSEPAERQFDAWGNTIAGQLWSGSSAVPRLCLHGWLDNSGSFDPIAPLLNGPLFAADLAGHGLSSHRSRDSTYNIWQDVGDMIQVADQLGWDSFNVIGHSRGAIISTLLAASFPERVNRLVLLDGLLAEPFPAEDAPRQLAKSVTGRQKYPDYPVTFYATLEDALATRLKGGIALSREAARVMARRGVARSDRGFYWRADRRLLAPSEFKLTGEHAVAFVSALKCPAQLFLAQGREWPFIQELASLNDNIQLRHVDGGHHCHMDEERFLLADEINRFLAA